MTLQEQVRPSDLSGTYSRILSKIKKIPGRWEIVRKLLVWLTCAKRPITLRELSCALAIDAGDRFLDNEKRLFHDELILDICGPLIRLTKSSQTCLVEFSHFSVVEYVTNKLPTDEGHDFF